jgi:hypothetical protein
MFGGRTKLATTPGLCYACKTNNMLVGCTIPSRNGCVLLPFHTAPDPAGGYGSDGTRSSVAMMMLQPAPCDQGTYMRPDVCVTAQKKDSNAGVEYELIRDCMIFSSGHRPL